MINLLPPEEKNHLIKEENRRLWIIFGFLAVVFALSLCLLLLIVRVHIDGKINEQKMAVQLENERIKLLQAEETVDDIRTADNNLKELDSFYQTQIDLTRVLEELAQLLPSGVYLTNFNYRGGDEDLAITGHSPTRDALVELKNRLEQAEDFHEIAFPPGSWVKSTDIDFSFTLRLTSLEEIVEPNGKSKNED